MLGAPVTSATTVLAGLVVVVALDLLPIGTVAVVVIHGIAFVAVGMERGHPQGGSTLFRQISERPMPPRACVCGRNTLGLDRIENPVREQTTPSTVAIPSGKGI